MSTRIPNQQSIDTESKATAFSRGFSMLYASLAYCIGAGALFWFFFAAIGMAPYSLSGIEAGNMIGALSINLVLVSLFALQHTIMARKGFKQKWTQIIPVHLERATFVWASGLLMVCMLWFWQPLPGVIWSIEHEYTRLALFGLCFAGVVYVLITSLVTNHFELFGLRQAWLYATNKSYLPLEFKRQWVYRYSRHPMMLGLLIVIWSTPDMSATRMTLAVLLTMYLFIGIRFEERELLQEFGDNYRKYRQEVGLFFTFR